MSKEISVEFAREYFLNKYPKEAVEEFLDFYLEKMPEKILRSRENPDEISVRTLVVISGGIAVWNSKSINATIYGKKSAGFSG